MTLNCQCIGTVAGARCQKCRGRYDSIVTWVCVVQVERREIKREGWREFTLPHPASPHIRLLHITQKRKWTFLVNRKKNKWQLYIRLVNNTSLLTPYSGVVFEKLTGYQLVKEFPAFYVTRRFITAFTSAQHLSLFWATSIQSIQPLSNSWWSI